jgi:DNA primase
MEVTANGSMSCPFKHAPWGHEDRTPSFTVNRERGTFKCFGRCQISGDAIAFIGFWNQGQAYDNRKRAMFLRAKQDLLDLYGGTAVVIQRKAVQHVASRYEARHADREVQRIWKLAAGYYGELLVRSADALRYVRDERGFTMDTLKRWKFGYVPYEGTHIADFLWRTRRVSEEKLLKAGILHTFQTAKGPWTTEFQRGRIVFFDTDRYMDPHHMTGRAFPYGQINPDAPKLMAVPGFTKPVFGLKYLNKATRPVILVEGPWDAMTLIQWGYDAVALDGLYMSREHTDALLTLERPLVPLYDNDEAGEKARTIWRAAIPALHRRAIELPAHIHDHPIKDPNDLLRRFGLAESKIRFDKLLAKHPLFKHG